MKTTVPQSEIETKQKEKIVRHLLFAPLALLAFIGIFTHLFVIIPSAGQLAFGLTAMALTICILKRPGRTLLHALKQQPDDATSQPTKSLFSYYGIFLLIAAIIVAAGLFLNAHYPDLDRQTEQMHEMEQLFSINHDTENINPKYLHK
ncbi:MAG: hypothetical protein HDS39_00090 [Bacteroides sp.]|nr:hypothetical protein [Bacteroides sp.]